MKYSLTKTCTKCKFKHTVQVTVYGDFDGFDDTQKRMTPSECPFCIHQATIVTQNNDVIDKGPWEVDNTGRTIYSDDFTHDVHLSVHGDFADDAERKRYAESIADALTVAAISHKNTRSK